jgi:putative ABC transport system permease protein
MIVGEALILGVAATLAGLAGGIVVAKLIVAAFNAAGLGFPPTAIIMKPRTVVMAAIVGIALAPVGSLDTASSCRPSTPYTWRTWRPGPSCGRRG